MTLSPTERRELLHLAATQLVEQLRSETELDELNTLDVATAAQLLGISPKQAFRLLPVIQVGPRTHRVTVAAYKAFLAENAKSPATR